MLIACLYTIYFATSELSYIYGTAFFSFFFLYQSKKFASIEKLTKDLGGSPEEGETTPNNKSKIRKEYKKSKIEM